MIFCNKHVLGNVQKRNYHSTLDKDSPRVLLNQQDVGLFVPFKGIRLPRCLHYRLKNGYHIADLMDVCEIKSAYKHLRIPGRRCEYASKQIADEGL